MGLRKEHQRHSRHITRTKRWQVLRMEILERDRFRCCSCGCGGRLEVDHVKPVRTHPKLAYEPGNLQALCPSCHTRKTRIECGHKPMSPARRDWSMAVQAMEKKKDGRTYSIPLGIAASRIPVNLVFGPPGSGKSFYIAAHARPGDVVIDLDTYLIALGGAPWEREPALVRAAFKDHDADIYSLASRTRGTAWLAKLAPSLAERNAWKLALRRVSEVPILTPPETCIQRIRADPARQHRADEMCSAVHDWWRAYRADNGTNPVEQKG